jgi:uncharacterized protein (TIGR02246 family)
MTDRGAGVGLDRSMDREVRALYRALIEGWNRRDAAAMARLFAASGSVVGFDGSQIDGAAEIEAVMGSIFAHHTPPPFISIIREVRRLGAGTALLRAVVGMVPPGKTELDPALTAIQSLIAVRTGDRWRIALFQNTPAAFHRRPELVAAMTEELNAAREGDRRVAVT